MVIAGRPETAKAIGSLLMISTKDITSLVERLEAFEERLGIRIESIYAEWKDYGHTRGVTILGELHPRDGVSLNQDIELIAAVHDSSSRIIGRNLHWIYAEDFFGFETFQCHISDLPSVAITKIRLYPKAL